MAKMNVYEYNWDRTEKALLLAQEIGGRSGLNCVAELDPAVIKQVRNRTQVPVSQAKEDRGEEKPLAGIPVLVKDNIDVKGLHTTAGSLALEDNIAQSDAPIIRNLRKNGAVILGKTNMTEFANYVTDNMPGGYSSRGGQVIHATDPNLSPSGSSSGSAVAVAAGIVPMAVGTDTSHSVTACAMFNGICGLKPPVGTLSSEGIIPIARTLDSAGAMARNMTDALRLYSAMRDEPLPELKPIPLNQFRIAVNRANEEMAPQEMKTLFPLLIHCLRENGTEIGEVWQPPVPELVTIMQWEFKPHLEDYLRTSSASRKTLADIVAFYESHPETMMKYGDTLLRAALNETPGGLSGQPYLDALKTRRETILRITEEISDYDAVIMTGPTHIMHFCGLPSVTVAGSMKAETGVNQAVILYGKDEYRLYEAALAVEQVIRHMGESR